MAGLYQWEGDYAAARAYYQQVLEILKESYRSQYPDSGQIVEQFRRIYRDIGDYSSAPLLRASAGYSQTNAGDKASGYDRHAL